MSEAFSRTEKLLGPEAMERLAQARVAVFGLGGVGGYVVEALARSGIGALDLVDMDTVAESNLNRQILALHSTLGLPKVEASAARVRDIHPACTVRTWPVFYLPETRGQFDFTAYDYVVDAIDTVSGKIALVLQAREAGVPIILAMGAGNKLDPTGFRVADLAQTKVCPLAKVMRHELGKRGITHVKVVYSEEAPLRPREEDLSAAPAGMPKEAVLEPAGEDGASAAPAPKTPAHPKQTPGSVAFVPSVMGLILASEVVKDLAQGRRPLPH